MPILRSLILKFVSAETAHKMEAESRAWKLKCKCGNETDYWEIGGIRYKAASRGKKMLIRCPKCGVTWHDVYYDKDAAIVEKQLAKA
jgi:hypothetical protein